MRFILATVALLLIVAAPAAAQDEVVPAPEPRLSPLALAMTTIGDTYVKVHYGSPQRRHPETGEPSMTASMCLPVPMPCSPSPVKLRGR